MSQTYQTTRRVEFRDTDAAGIVHFSAFVVFMEQAEHEFLRSLDLSVHHPLEQGAMSWPRVSVHCDFRSPAKFEDLLRVAVQVERIGTRSVTYRYAFEHQDGRPVADGTITAVCCHVDHGRPPKSIDIPDWFKAKLGPFVNTAT